MSPGVGILARCASRISNISAAAIGCGAAVISAWPFKSICQARPSRAMPMPASAVTASRSASSRLSLPPPAASMLARCTRSIRSAIAISGSAPFACAFARAASAFAALPAIAASSMAMESLRPGRPSIAAILSASILSAVIAAAWSSNDKASRTDPSAARAITCKASGAASIVSRVQMLARWVASTSLSTRRRSKR